MNFQGEHRLDAPRELVWQAVNNVETLQRSIPGCAEFTQTGDSEYLAIVQAKLGPVSARFKTSIKVADMLEPESYRLIIHGAGGAQGMGDGVADVRLIDVDDQTLLKYIVDFRVRGRLAQVGSRLLLNALKKLATDFFTAFAADVEARRGTV